MTGKLQSTCFACEVRQSTEWCDLNERALLRLDAVRCARKYEAGTVLFRQGDECKGIYCINAGLVGIRKVDAAGHSTL